jgi:hypothetical protein
VYWSLPVSVDSEHQVSLALARLLRRLGGSLWHNKLVDPVLRGAILIDWTLSGRLVEDDTDIELDTTPTGNPAADALLARISEYPEHPLMQWLLDEQPTQSQLVGYLVENGVFIPTDRHHYLDSRDYELLPLWTRLCGVIQGDQREEPPVVALAVLAQLLGVLSSRASAANDDVVAQAGALTGLLTVIRDFAAERLAAMRTWEPLDPAAPHPLI